MTNNQYEHVGRAMMIAVDFAQGLDNLYETRSELEYELKKLIPESKAQDLIQYLMVLYKPTFHLGEFFTDIANAIAAKQEAK